MADPAPLRVTMSTIAYWPSVGGSQLYVQRIAEALCARGHDVEVLTGEAPIGGPPGAPERVGPVVVRRHPVPRLLLRLQRAVRGTWMRRPTSGDPWDLPLHPLLVGPLSPGLLGAIRRAGRERDVVVAGPAPWLTLTAPAAWRGRARVVGLPQLHVSRTEPHRVVARSLRRCDVVVTATAHEAATVRRAGAARVETIPLGTDPGAFVDLDPSTARAELGLPERPTVGYVGRIARHKGIDTLLAAADRLWRDAEGPTVVVAGATTGWDGLRPEVERRGTEDRLVVRTDVSDEERALLLAACDVVVLASSDESFGIGVAEAWAARRPVVASDIPVLRELVRDGVDGRTFPLGDAEALADVLAQLLAAPDGTRAMGDEGRRRVDAELRWDVVVDRWVELVEGAAPGREGR
ncbi:MAG: glycosyltransferase family 4 protein [Acidimicrobiales bacterium]